MVTSLASFSASMQKNTIALPTIISTTQKYANLSANALCDIGRRYLAHYEVLNQEIYIQVVVRELECIEGKITDSYQRATSKQSIRNGTISTQKHDDVIPNNAQKFLTTNEPARPPSAAFRASEIFSKIKKTMLQTAPLLAKPQEFQWRLDIANYSIDELSEAALRLQGRGFSVAMTRQHIKIEDVRRKVKISSTQYLCVTIPHPNAVKESDKKFSAYQIYETMRRISENFAPQAQSKEYVLRGFNAELDMIAKESPLVTVYPLDTACLNATERDELQEQLQQVGYKVTQDKPYFLVQEMDGLVFHKHDLLVELTSSPVPN